MARHPKTEFEKGNQANLIHGGEAAVKDLQRGEPLRGPAREVELAVIGELETRGRYAIVKRNATRLQAACDLYWSAIAKVMEAIEERSGEVGILLPKLDGYIARFGWLAQASLRAWSQVKEEEPRGDTVLLDAIKAADEDT